jgi:hypothetical protein
MRAECNSWFYRYTRQDKCRGISDLLKSIQNKSNRKVVLTRGCWTACAQRWRFKNSLMSISRTTQGAFYKADVMLPALCLPPASDIITELRNYPLTWTLDSTLQVVDRRFILLQNIEYFTRIRTKAYPWFTTTMQLQVKYFFHTFNNSAETRSREFLRGVFFAGCV